MTRDWIEVSDVRDLGDLLATELPGGSELLAALSRLPGADDWWSTTIEIPPTRYINGQPVMELQIMRTRYFFNWSAARKLRGDVFVIATAYAMTSSIPTAGAIGAVKKVLETFRSLTDDELELVGVIMGIAGRRPYEVSVPEKRIRDAYQGASVDVNELLDSIESKAIIRKERGEKVRLVP